MDYNRFDLRDCVYDFASDNINIFALVYDASGSMESYISAMQKANKAFLKDFSKFDEKGSISVCKVMFSDKVVTTPFDFVDNFSTKYAVYGNTALYAAINYSVKNTISYYNEIVKRLKVRPKITYLVFSDGEDNRGGVRDFEAARNSVKELNSLDATTVFVAFSNAIKNRDGDKLGFSCTKNISSVRELISCMGAELSKSCKEQSKSAYSLKSEFFSKVEDNSEDDDTGKQAFLDDDFFNI